MCRTSRRLDRKLQTRWTGIDNKILSLYARGMTVSEIQGHLQEMYGTEVSPTLNIRQSFRLTCGSEPWSAPVFVSSHLIFCKDFGRWIAPSKVSRSFFLPLARN